MATTSWLLEVTEP
uniref:Uncharacterized protein n=1 Tax=Arundo donax TaxID=35708 RepID=A0A0A9ACZ5_ARUDO